MNLKYLLFVAASIVLLASCKKDRSAEVCYRWEFDTVPADYVQYTDPFIGTGGHGHTYPGATAPFGMVQLSPDTRIDDSWDGCSGYHYSDSLIYGFSHTHLSGTGCSDYGDILLMPGSGEHRYTSGSDGKPGYRSSYSHSNEKATAGYYSVALDNGVRAELTASPRVGVHRYTFPKEKASWMILDMAHRDQVLDCLIEIVDDHTIRGRRFSKAWANDQRLWFYARFSQPFKSTGFWSEGKTFQTDSASRKDLKLLLDFGNIENLEVQVALSPVSSENAELNLETETGKMDFEQVKKKVTQNWNAELAQIHIESKDKSKLRNFYTALYHCFVAPNVYCDVNGEYRGMDHQVYKDTVHQRYSVFSLWDTYRALHPLFTLIQQKRTGDFINTFLCQYKESGRLPVWELSSNETDCMIGYHSVPVIADAWLKGIRGYDTAVAYEAMKSSAMQDRSGLTGYRKCGYIPAEGESESVSKTLEYAFDDWCISQVAHRMKDEEGAGYFYKRSQTWKNLHDPVSHFHRARMNNTFVTPFRPDEVNFHYTEANAWQYSLAVQHDIQGLVIEHGGPEQFEIFLDSLFSASSVTTGRDQADITGLIGQYAHGNEPSHHMAYLYNYAGRPNKTQEIITRIVNELYHDQPDGLSGNEDCGQMSAWYVLSVAGFYPVNPCGGEFELGYPQADRITFHLENGNTFSVIPQTQESNDLREPWITFENIMAGGDLYIPKYPAREIRYRWERENKYYKGPDKLPAPLVKEGTPRTFTGAMTIELQSLRNGTDIWYTMNNGSAMLYEKPLVIKENTILKTWSTVNVKSSFSSGNSDTVEAQFNVAPDWKVVSISHPYAPQYAAGGDAALLDGLRGTDNFRTGMWQGYEGVDLDIVIDLGKTVETDSVYVHFLHDQRSWIFLPEKVIFHLSDSPNAYPEPLVESKPDCDAMEQEVHLVKMGGAMNSKGRYLHVIAVNRKNCPEGHPGAGHKAWLFADEIILKTK